MKTADVVIIGAGVNGSSIAYNLVHRGLKKVVLLEKGLVASGGTGRSAAIIRQHYSHPELVKMVKRSVEIFHDFEDIVGGDPGFVKCGWAFLVPDYVSDGFSQNLKMQQNLGIETQEITKCELLKMEPRINLDNVHRICYEKGSGYASSHKTTYSYVQKFCQLGGELMQTTAAVGLKIENGQVTGVCTEEGDISTEVVINAAGPWAKVVASWAGLDIPIQVTREEEIIIESADVDKPPNMVFSDMVNAIYYRPDGLSRILVGRGFPKEYENVDPDHFNQLVGKAFIQETWKLFLRRFPVFSRAIVINAYTGLYDVTPDWNPILGRVEEVQGFYMCAGFSGHGFKIAPSVGELMAEEIGLGGEQVANVNCFALSRFKKGNLLEGVYGGNRA